MRIICSIHGCQPVVSLSADLWDVSGPPVSNVIRVRYEHLGQIVESVTLSASFAEQHRISGGVFPLPDDYPVWINDLVHRCAKCYEART